MNSAGIQRDSGDWSWEYNKNPFGQLIGIAESGGQVIGHMALVPLCVKIGSENIKGCQAVDLVVHPKFRGQGIFLAIGKFLMNEAGKQGISIAYGFPNKLAHSGHLKYGWFDVCEVPLLVKPIAHNKIADFVGENRIVGFLSRHSMLKRMINSLLRAVVTTISCFAKIFYRVEIDNASSFEIRLAECFDNRIDDFWRDVSKDYVNIVVRDSAYLNWRYFQKPKGKYSILIAERHGKILGYVVLRLEIVKNLRIGCVVDILASLEHKAIVQLLTSKALEQLRRDNVDLVVCWMSNSSWSGDVYYRALRANGFIRVPGRSTPFIIRVNSLNLSPEHVRDPATWYITLGDSDHV
jgi:GNAT superfamily N-acetyltransferase